MEVIMTCTLNSFSIHTHVEVLIPLSARLIIQDHAMQQQITKKRKKPRGHFGKTLTEAVKTSQRGQFVCS